MIGVWGENGSLVPLMDLANHDVLARVRMRGFESDIPLSSTLRGPGSEELEGAACVVLANPM